MVTLDKPIGLTLAPDPLTGQVRVSSLTVWCDSVTVCLLCVLWVMRCLVAVLAGVCGNAVRCSWFVV